MCVGGGLNRQLWRCVWGEGAAPTWRYVRPSQDNCGRQDPPSHPTLEDLINAGAEFVDEAVVVDTSSNPNGLSTIITSRTPNDLTPFCQVRVSE